MQVKRMTVALALALTAGVTGASGAVPKMAAHKAFYQIDLIPGREANLLSASGRMAYEVAGSSCEGWTVNYRLVNDFKPGEGEARIVDSTSTSYEAGDGTSFSYASKEYINNRLDNEEKVSVDRQAGSEGQGMIKLPKEEPFTLPAAAIFPMQHQIKFLTAAMAGETRDSSIVYDGGDGARIYKVITFIGAKKIVTPETDQGDAAALAKLSAWPVSISYYPEGELQEGENADTPLYQVSFDMYENGVAQKIVLDYGDFALSGKLINYEAGKETSCD